MTRYEMGARAANRAGAPMPSCPGGSGPCECDQLRAFEFDLADIGRVVTLARTRLDGLRLALAYAEQP